jgi:hypothetical protein
VTAHEVDDLRPVRQVLDQECDETSMPGTGQVLPIEGEEASMTRIEESLLESGWNLVFRTRWPSRG